VVLLLVLVLVLLLMLLVVEPFRSPAVESFRSVPRSNSRVIRVSSRRATRVSVEDRLDVRRRSGEAQLAVASGARVGTTVGGGVALDGALGEGGGRREELAVEGCEDVGEGVGAGTEGTRVEVDLEEEKGQLRRKGVRGEREKDAPSVERGTPQPNPDSSRGNQHSTGSSRTE
jgi:hypothetical protein